MARHGGRAGQVRGFPVAVEALEGRRLLTTSATFQTVSSGHASYLISVTGPGAVSVRKAGKGQFAIELFQTTAASTVTVAQSSTSNHYVAGSFLPVARIDASSGQLGGILGLGAVELEGSITISGPVGQLQLGTIDRTAQVSLPGGLGSLAVSGAITLGPKGKLAIGDDLSGALQAGSITLDGGQLTIGHDLGSLTVGSLILTNNGVLSVGHDTGLVAINQDTYLASGGSIRVGADVAGLNFGHNLTLAPGGEFAVSRDVTAPVTVNGSVAISAGQFLVGRDLLGLLSINGDLSAANGGNLTVGRNLAGGLAINGDLTLLASGSLVIGRDVESATGLTVGGNVVTAAGGSIQVGGNLDAFIVNGTIVGQGSTIVDLNVGLDLNNWTVSGGAPNQGGVSGFNVAVAKNLVGFNIVHGLFNDFITAGVLINQGTVGADGPVAAFDTEIRAGVQITNVTFTGDVKSDRPVNPLGRRTRIIAGEDRAGNFEVGGNMVNVIVTGSLIDAVLVASVQPYGGTGQVTLTPAPIALDNPAAFYDAPLGGIYRSATNGFSNLGLPYAAPPFDTATDPTVHDTVLPGSINRPFAPIPSTTGKPVFPSVATIQGAVITTAHVNDSDYAGVFAADTSGVFVGTLPPG